MSQEQVQVAEKTQQMLQGPLKHVRAAALAAALVPLASVVATPAVGAVGSVRIGRVLRPRVE